MSGFNWVDLVAFSVLIYFVYQGFASGFLASVLNLVSTALSFVLAVTYYSEVSSLLGPRLNLSGNLSPIIAFFVLLIVGEVIFGYLSSRVYLLLSSFLKLLPPLYYVDKFLGILPSLLIGVVLITSVLFLPLTLPIQSDLKSTIQNSWWGRTILPKALAYEPALESYLGKLPTRNLLYVITKEPDSNETIKLNLPFQKNLTVDEASEKKMLELVNQERTPRGLKALRMDPTIREVARAHSLDMFKRDYFSHYTLEGLSPFDRMKAGGVTFLSAGENIAYAPTVEIAHQGLMNSPGHRENILRPEFGRVGIGIIDGGIFGKMFTQDFAN